MRVDHTPGRRYSGQNVRQKARSALPKGRHLHQVWVFLRFVQSKPAVLLDVVPTLRSECQVLGKGSSWRTLLGVDWIKGWLRIWPRPEKWPRAESASSGLRDLRRPNSSRASGLPLLRQSFLCSPRPSLPWHTDGQRYRPGEQRKEPNPKKQSGGKSGLEDHESGCFGDPSTVGHGRTIPERNRCTLRHQAAGCKPDRAEKELGVQ